MAALKLYPSAVFKAFFYANVPERRILVAVSRTPGCRDFSVPLNTEVTILHSTNLQTVAATCHHNPANRQPGTGNRLSGNRQPETTFPVSSHRRSFLCYRQLPVHQLIVWTMARGMLA